MNGGFTRIKSTYLFSPMMVVIEKLWKKRQKIETSTLVTSYSMPGMRWTRIVASFLSDDIAQVFVATGHLHDIWIFM